MRTIRYIVSDNSEERELLLTGLVVKDQGSLRVNTVNTEIFNLVLADVAREFDLNENKRMLLVLDQAGWHRGHELKIPEGIDLLDLPAYSPELQPAERLWPLVDEAIANNTPKDLNELEQLLVYRCQKLMKEHQLIRGLTCYHWWPKTREVIYN